MDRNWLISVVIVGILTAGAYMLTPLLFWFLLPGTLVDVLISGAHGVFATSISVGVVASFLVNIMAYRVAIATVQKTWKLRKERGVI
jgi:hypothetical protein